jgi:hypothetical protein
MRHLTPALLLSLAASACIATPQIPDTLRVDGETAPIFSAPLLPLVEDEAFRARLHPLLGSADCSGSWHGFRANWSIEGRQLILLSIESQPCSDAPRPIPLASLFGGRRAPIAATWYSGPVVLPRGAVVKRDHFSGRHQHERYRIFTIVQGAVVAEEERSQLP